MAAVPITFRGMMYPKNKTVAPYPFTALGTAEITGLEVGGGPIIPPPVELPPDETPKPPLVIWGGPFEPPYVSGGPIDPYPDIGLPPAQPPSQPTPPHEGWNWSFAKSGWYYVYVPGEGEAQPKRR